MTERLWREDFENEARAQHLGIFPGFAVCYYLVVSMAHTTLPYLYQKEIYLLFTRKKKAIRKLTGLVLGNELITEDLWDSLI